VEQGEQPGIPPPSTRETLIERAQALRAQAIANLSRPAA
jgi:hypothetical protein